MCNGLGCIKKKQAPKQNKTPKQQQKKKKQREFSASFNSAVRNILPG